MKKRIIYFLFLTTVLFSACSTDLDVIGNYKETLVVYGLLDQSQSKQYIKINKAFLGAGNSIEYAQIKDSTQFFNSLSVKIRRSSDGMEFPLTPDNSIIKDPGTFYAPDQDNVIYSFVSRPDNVTNYLPNTTPGGSQINYDLIVKSNETGTEVTSQTSLISDATITAPSVVSAISTFGIVTVNNTYFNISWNTGKNARLYQAIIRFNYIDSTLIGNDTNHLDWVFPTQTTQGLAGNESMTEQFKGQAFLQFVGNQLGTKPLPVARRALKTEIILVAGSDDLHTFIEVNAPSTGIVQEKPEFTNINNGLGIFSSRYNKAPFGKNLSATTLDSLACGQYTKTLKFLDKNGNQIVCP